MIISGENMNKKEKIKELKKNNRAFSKGSFWTKLSVFLCLLCIALNQGYLFIETGEFSLFAIIHLVLQSAASLLILTGGVWIVVMYFIAMLSSSAIALWLYLGNHSMFYLVQCVFFAVSFFLMFLLLVLPSVRTYRKELKKLRKNINESSQEVHEPEKLEEKTEVSFEPVEEKPEEKVEDPVKAEVEKTEEKMEESVEVVAEKPVEKVEEPVKPAAEEPVEKTELEEDDGSMLQVLCPSSAEFTYGSFSRFLMQHYPFVYLHPKFAPEQSKFVQMCISSEGFEQSDEALYDAQFRIYIQPVKNAKLITMKFDNAMGYLSALICVDWLIAQKSIFIQDNKNVSAYLMKHLTYAFNLAKESEKSPFKGFTNR